jgi:5'(3')-deoxyribonucleotidase
MKPKKKLFLDLDGVVVDWLGGSMKVCGLTDKEPAAWAHLKAGNKIDSLIPGGRAALTAKVDAMGPAFWQNLEFLPWGVQLVERLRVEFQHTHDFAFLTSPGPFPLAAQGKLRWLLDNFPDEEMIICRSKELCAHPNAFLVDDADYQIEPFIKDGGCGFLWPNQYVLRDDPDLNAADKAIDRCVNTIKLVHGCL